MEQNFIKPPVEIRYAHELAALAASDTGKKPENWKLSPKAVRTFILGGSIPTSQGTMKISRKFYGNDALVERCIITLAGSRGLMLVGEPGTAKTMPSASMTYHCKVQAPQQRHFFSSLLFSSHYSLIILLRRRFVSLSSEWPPHRHNLL